MSDKLVYELRGRSSGNLFGYDIIKNGKRIEWSGASERLLVSSLTHQIMRESTEGGKIITYDPYTQKPVEQHVEPCPTNHANTSDDFMGGTICLDCKVGW